MVKLLYLNIFTGAKKKGRLEKIINFLKKQKVDMIFLAELSDWNKESLDNLRQKLGFKDSFFLKSNSHRNLGILSNVKISNVVSFKEGFCNSSICFKNKNIKFIFVHLSHVSEDERLFEIKKIFEKIKLNEKIIFIGDFNSLSPLDTYDEKFLIKIFKKINIPKFGIEKIRREVQEKILDFGLIDTLREFSDSFEYSVPTKFNKDSAHATKLRLDYLFITPSLLSNLKSSKIIRTEETNQLSDHFPIVAEFDF